MLPELDLDNSKTILVILFVDPQLTVRSFPSFNLTQFQVVYHEPFPILTVISPTVMLLKVLEEV